MMSKRFLAVGDYLINPDLLTYAVLERDGGRPNLRLGFASQVAYGGGELRLAGDEAREVLRWLRLNADFLTTAGGFGSIGGPATAEGAIESDSRSVARGPHNALARGWGAPPAAPKAESVTGLFG
jgi:hypothetical protein